MVIILNQDFLEKHLNEKWVKRSRCKARRDREMMLTLSNSGLDG